MQPLAGRLGRRSPAWREGNREPHRRGRPVEPHRDHGKARQRASMLCALSEDAVGSSSTVGESQRSAEAIGVGVERDRHGQRRSGRTARRGRSSRLEKDRDEHGRAAPRPRCARTPTTRSRPAGWPHNASEIAESGGEVVGRVVATMERDQREPRAEIVDIIGVIEGIAFQTNILALNAAVEAARGRRAGPRLCGGRGRGAQPGAALRQRRPRRNQGPDRRHRVARGRTARLTLTEARAPRMDEVVQAVKRVTDIDGRDSARPSAEQSRGIEQINRAVAQMDAGTPAECGPRGAGCGRGGTRSRIRRVRPNRSFSLRRFGRWRLAWCLFNRLMRRRGVSVKLALSVYWLRHYVMLALGVRALHRRDALASAKLAGSWFIAAPWRSSSYFLLQPSKEQSKKSSYGLSGYWWT